MVDGTERRNLKNKIKLTQQELVRLSFSEERDSQRHQFLLDSLNKARNQLANGLYTVNGRYSSHFNR